MHLPTQKYLFRIHPHNTVWVCIIYVMSKQWIYIYVTITSLVRET
jgi:hypothetical protein